MNRLANGGLAYRCNHCEKVDRKGRLVGHILRDHVPQDRVPFYCTLCRFRYETRDDYIKQLTKYAGHVRAVGNTPNVDLNRILIKSGNPWFVSSSDLTQVPDEDDDMFADQDEQQLPTWLREVTKSVASGSSQFPKLLAALQGSEFMAKRIDEDPLTTLVESLKTPQPSPVPSAPTSLQDEPVEVLPTAEDKADPLLFEVPATSETTTQTDSLTSTVALDSIQKAVEMVATACQTTARNTDRILDDMRRLERRVTSIERAIDVRRREK